MSAEHFDGKFVPKLKARGFEIAFV